MDSTVVVVAIAALFAWGLFSDAARLPVQQLRRDAGRYDRGTARPPLRLGHRCS